MNKIRLQKLGIILTLGLLFCLTFSSCSDSDDYYIVDGYLNYSTLKDNISCQTNKNGIYEFNVRFSLRSIIGYNPYDYLEKIDVSDSYFELNLNGEPFYRGDNIIIELSDYDNTNEDVRIEYRIDRTGTTSINIDADDPNYYDFMQYLFDELCYKGTVTLNIYADMISGEGPIQYQNFNVIIENDLKLHYWER